MTAVGGEEWRFRKGTAESSVQIHSRLAFTAAEGVRETVIAGLGLAIVSRWMMTPELAAGTVVPILTEWSLPPIALWAVFPSGRLPSAKARAFALWFEEHFGRDPTRPRPPAATSKSPTRGRVKIPHLTAAGQGMITRFDVP